MSPSDKPMSILKRLGDNWHVDDPYEKLIKMIVPNSKHTLEIQDILLHLYVDEHYGFKQSKNITKDTLYSVEIDCAEERIKEIDGEMKKEEETLEKLAQKFAEVEKYLEYSSNHVGEDEEDDSDYVAAPTEKGKGNLVKANTKKLSRQEIEKALEEKKKALTARNTKTAMATSQEKLFTLQKEKETLEKMNNHYQHYHYAEYGRKCSIKKLALVYEKDQNVEHLIQGIDELLSYYHMMKRRYIPNQTCSGKSDIQCSSVKSLVLCDSHFLPLHVAKYTEKGDPLVLKCSLSPV